MPAGGFLRSDTSRLSYTGPNSSATPTRPARLTTALAVANGCGTVTFTSTTRKHAPVCF
jgi:hypothetical protein